MEGFTFLLSVRLSPVRSEALGAVNTTQDPPDPSHHPRLTPQPAAHPACPPISSS